MTSNQRRKNLAKIKKTNKKVKKKIPYGLFILLFLIGILIIFLFTFSKFKNLDKIAIVANTENSDILVQSYDFEQNKIISIIIPKDTQLEVAYQYGFYQAKNIWQLGKNEGMEGELVRASVVKNFNFPVVGWVDWSDKKSLPEKRGFLWPRKSNLKVGDKLRMMVLSLRLKSQDQLVINLAETKILVKKKLADGEWGYVIQNEPIFFDLASIFNEVSDNENFVRAIVIDNSGKVGVGEGVGELMEILGVKVSSVKKEKEDNFDCIISGRNTKLAEKLSWVYGCEVGSEISDSDFDLQFKLGKEFARKY